MSNQDIYNIDNYTDAELLNILDLNNPTDRELEAKIISLVHKYENMQNKGGEKLVLFYKNIYDRFFIAEEEEAEEENIIEGMEVIGKESDLQKAQTTPVDNTTLSYINTALSTNTLSPNNTYTLEYTKDGSGLNPLLSQTTKQIILIDSKNRDNKNEIATNFSCELSTSLKDVVSLKLYSFNIPKTWYTINKNYGSNFFYLKGNSPGINDGAHDIKIEIPVGNYDTPNDLIGAVNNSIQILKTTGTYSDISFGTTSLSYNSSTTNASFVFDITKTYNEMYYDISFSNWTSPSITDSKSIPGFFGFNFETYSPSEIKSALTVLPESYKPESNNSIYSLDETNNYFTIIQYINNDPTTDYDENNSNKIQTIKIQIPLSTLSTVPQTYSQLELINNLNVQLSNNPYLEKPYSTLSVISIPFSSQIYGAGHSYFKLSLRLNRFETSNIKNSKIVVIFPPSVPNVSSIWVGNSSAFLFEKTQYELSNIISESASVETNVIINSTPSPSIIFTVIREGYNNYNNDNNNFKIYISNDNYLFNDYLSEINTKIKNFNTSSINTSNPTGIINLSNTNIGINDFSLFDATIDITKRFTNYDYQVDFTNTSLTALGFSITGIQDLSAQNIFVSNEIYLQSNGYVFDTNKNLFVINPKVSNGDSFTIQTPVSLENPTLLQDLEKIINAQFANYQDPTTGQNILIGTIISFALNYQTSKLTSTLTINVNLFLTQNDYSITFSDPNATPSWTNVSNSWYNYLKIPSPGIFNLNNYNVPNKTYSEIIGTTLIDAGQLEIIPTENDTIIISPQIPGLNIGTLGLYTSENTNTLIITVPKGNYSRQGLLDVINKLFTTTLTKSGKNIGNGSLFYSITIEGKLKTIIRLNINQSYYAQDYLLNFYDPYSYTSCFNIGKNIQNTSWDTTLGWMLGFRNYTEYVLSEFTVSGTNIITLTGDTAVSVALYNSFLIILNDYNLSHVNDSFITITTKETSIPLPSYASCVFRNQQNQIQNSVVSITNNGQNLTKNQIYALQEIKNGLNNINNLPSTGIKTSTKYYSPGPFTKDVLAIIPLKLSGQIGNTNIVDFGGSLQNQERKYLGPVNIQRISVALKNDRGEIVDLNGADWSFILICEQLYRK